MPGVAFPDTMIALRVTETEIADAYLSAVWSSGHLRAQIDAAAKTTDTPDPVATHTRVQTGVLHRAFVAVGREPFPGREGVTTAVQHRETAIGAADSRGLPSPDISTSGRGVMTAHTLATTASTAPLQRASALVRLRPRSIATPDGEGGRRVAPIRPATRRRHGAALRRPSPPRLSPVVLAPPP
jgi:hypothetical protein